MDTVRYGSIHMLKSKDCQQCLPMRSYLFNLFSDVFVLIVVLQLIIFTSASPSVRLFVCLLATLRKNYWTDLSENFTTDVSVDKEELIKFGFFSIAR